MKNIASLTLFLWMALGVVAQTAKDKRAAAEEAVVQMRSGYILVRLHTRKNAIEALLHMGNEEGANNVRLQQEKVNREIQQAFRQHFRFCEVRFFYSDDSRFIKNGEFRGHLLNDSLQRDTSIAIDTAKPVFVVDIGDVYFPAFGSHMLGLVVMNDQFEPLEKPFPYFVRKRSGLFFLRRTNTDMVMILQRNLMHFYQAESRND